MEEQEGAVSDAGETGQEVPVCSGHKHPGRACVQLDGFPVVFRRLSLSGT